MPRARHPLSSRPASALASLALSLALTSVASPARADDVLHVGAAKLDPPTIISLGVQLMVTGDDDYNASVTLRYRKSGEASWKTGLPLHRVHPSVVVGRTVAPQLAGSIFELSPDTAYDIELHALDPDGSVDQILTLSGRTRAVPRADPKTPRAVAVTDAASLRAALTSAKAGDVITLANGTYPGTFQINASGTVGDPIVIRGASQAGVVLDGQGCTGCNIVEVYGSFVHIERLTLANAERSVRWQTAAAEGNVLRRARVTNVTLGVGGQPDQKGFTICDNVFEGRLAWPLTYGDDGAAHASDDGIVVSGTGHVVCHNTISGFADALQNFQSGTRANDFYGNEILWTYDDGIELDGMEGNGRCFRNRFMNTYDTLSFQPIYGGPAYVFRNVVVNVDNEQMKLHALGSSGGAEEPSGVYAFHNTFVRPYHAIQLSTPNVVRYYAVMNNLFIAPAQVSSGRVVAWDTPIDFTTGTIDYNGYFPDGEYEFGYGASGATYPTFAAVKAAGRYEKHGVLVSAATFANGLGAPTDHHPKVAPADVALASGALAVDKGVLLANVNDGFHGAAPDLGALEFGCPSPIYGVRPDGVDETNEPIGCASLGGGGVDGGVGVGADGGSATGDGGALDGGGGNSESGGNGASSGCGCRAATSTSTSAFAIGLFGVSLALCRVGVGVGVRSRRRRRVSER